MGVFHKLFGKYLLATNIVSCGVMMGIGDWLQQRGEHWKRHHLPKYFPTEIVEDEIMKEDLPKKTEDNSSYEHDYMRTRNMVTVGLMQGPFHHYFYAVLDRVLPGRNTSSVMKKTFIDQIVASPTCLAIFFFGIGAMEQRKIEDINDEVKLKFVDTWKVDCCFWPPTQFVNFLFVPVQYRVIYINLMTMIYDIFLSHMKYEAQFD
ncbi:mpv17-like protein 2 [Cephus cinctus]|uniref:Mpv17-like protein 2 n=1 Tax=Cephus cinctus TaxID=211228 RepID=A0AAJ7CE16_CEPCN|nr:mpv17-like protein 2 [Cephus cinctus]